MAVLILSKAAACFSSPRWRVCISLWVWWWAVKFWHNSRCGSWLIWWFQENFGPFWYCEDVQNTGFPQFVYKLVNDQFLWVENQGVLLFWHIVCPCPGWLAFQLPWGIWRFHWGCSGVCQNSLLLYEICHQCRGVVCTNTLIERYQPFWFEKYQWWAWFPLIGCIIQRIWILLQC